MKIIVTHTFPDWDAIGSAWLIRRFLPGWKDTVVEFVPAGERSERVRNKKTVWEDAVEKIGDLEIIHVDTGMGPLDHHQTSDINVCGASNTWDYVQKKLKEAGEKMTDDHVQAISRIMKIIVAIDHFREVFWEDAAADYQEFSLVGVLEGLKLAKPDNDMYYVTFGEECLNALVHEFENRIWAEREIKENGIAFITKWGKAMGFATINDTVLKLAQKMGYVVVVRKDPRKGYLRIKARPLEKVQSSKFKVQNDKKDIDLTLAYEKLSKIDPDATWYLHVSKKMLLNGTPKNPKMIPTKLSLEQVIEVLKGL